MSTRETACVVLACDDCGQVAFNGDDHGEHASELHFGDVVEAYRTAREAGWWAERDRVVCGWCLTVAACVHLGHQWSQWHETDGPWWADHYRGRARICGECQTVDYHPPLPPMPQRDAT